jgi:hypothetical protein
LAKNTIAELAQHKADLLEELSEVNAEIASRAGEGDESTVDAVRNAGHPRSDYR